MARITGLLILAGSLFASIAQAADAVCLMFLPEWECDVCGGYSPSSPIVCSPFNATFDDLPSGKPVGIYKSTNWTNFNVATPGNTNAFTPHVNAYSKPNYALLPAGQKGNLTFGYDNGVDPGLNQYPFGALYSLHYACAQRIPHSSFSVPTACEVTVTADCLPTTELQSGNTTRSSFTLNYTPNNPVNANMTFAQGFPPTNDSNTICTTYAFEAKSAFGTKVDFLLDEVLFHTFQQGVAL